MPSSSFPFFGSLRTIRPVICRRADVVDLHLEERADRALIFVQRNVCDKHFKSREGLQRCTVVYLRRGTTVPSWGRTRCPAPATGATLWFAGSPDARPLSDQLDRRS
jgi:hypothetical protein